MLHASCCCVIYEPSRGLIVPDYSFVLARFRAGYLGPITLDDVGQFSLQEKTSQQQPIREHAGSDASDVIAASESASPVPLAVDTYEDTEKFETKEKVLAYNPNDIFG